MKLSTTTLLEWRYGPKGNMDRVSKGECSPSLTAPFNDVMHCINRMGNSCMNIAEAVAGEMSIEYFIHEKEPVKA